MGARHLIVLVLAATLGAHSQATKSPSGATPSSERGWTFNFPQTPLEISADREWHYDLENKAKTPIKRFRLGCVRDFGNKNLVIVHRMFPEDETIAPGEGWFVLTADGNFARACKQYSAKLAVIEVDFGDGTAWRAPAKVQED